MQAQNLKLHLKKEILEVVDLYRGIILDTVEQELGDSPKWKFIRSRVLNCFGDRGLSEKIKNIIDEKVSAEELKK